MGAELQRVRSTQRKPRYYPGIRQVECVDPILAAQLAIGTRSRDFETAYEAFDSKLVDELSDPLRSRRRTDR